MTCSKCFDVDVVLVSFLLLSRVQLLVDGGEILRCFRGGRGVGAGSCRGRLKRIADGDDEA